MGAMATKNCGRDRHRIAVSDSDEEAADMSAARELAPGRSLPPSLPPPADGRCFLFDHLNPDTFEIVLDELQTRDLVAFIQTSKTAKDIVDKYVDHSVKKGER
jgi:hypothetical protein